MRADLIFSVMLFLFTAPAMASEDLSLGGSKLGGFGSSPSGQFLPVGEAFQAQAWRENDRLYVSFSNAEGYYLHREQFALASRNSAVRFGPLDLPPGELTKHAYLGKMYVFYNSVVFSATVEAAQADPGTLPITVTFQGCSDAGLCYPPKQIDLEAFSGPPSNTQIFRDSTVLPPSVIVENGGI